MEARVIKTKLGELSTGAKGDVIHFASVSSLAVCFFLDDGSLGGGVALDQLEHDDDFRSLRTSLEAIVDKIGMTRVNQCQLKLLGHEKPVSQASLIAEKYGFKIAGTDLAQSDAFEIYFYPDIGRLRYRNITESSDKSTVAKPKPKIRVLIVDDSKTIQRLLSDIVSDDPELEVAGVTDKPLEVERLVKELKPDVMTLDIKMPGMDGVTLVQKLLPIYPVPTIMITSLSLEDGNQVLQALELGAVDYVHKPSLDELQQVAIVIRGKIKTAASAKVIRAPTLFDQDKGRIARNHTLRQGNMPIVAIGASTGGTDAIQKILSVLPEHIPPMVIVQHIPPLFSGAFARRLNASSPFEVFEAADGDELMPGRILIAPGGFQMEVVRKAGKLCVSIADNPLVNGHKPSVDVLFNSVAATCGANAVGIILTGMGDDGARGLLKMREQGAHTLAQDEASSVVFGMPGVAVSLGAAQLVKPLKDIPAQIMDWASEHQAA